ncbi:MAG: ABC transporter permease [Ezakiella sp.]
MKKILKNLYISLIYLFFYLPIIILIIYSFNATKSRVVWGGFSLKWYQELFQSKEVLMSFYNTILIGVLSTTMATIIGTIGAIGLFRAGGRVNKFFMELNYLPILNPDIVIAVSLVALYNFIKLDFGYLTIILSHVAFTTPYVVFNVMPRLSMMNPNLYEAALDLGSTRWENAKRNTSGNKTGNLKRCSCGVPLSMKLCGQLLQPERTLKHFNHCLFDGKAWNKSGHKCTFNFDVYRNDCACNCYKCKKK